MFSLWSLKRGVALREIGSTFLAGYGVVEKVCEFKAILRGHSLHTHGLLPQGSTAYASFPRDANRAGDWAGVNGDTSAAGDPVAECAPVGQNFVSQARLVVRDAAGLNPDPGQRPGRRTSPMARAGDRVLIVSSSFTNLTTPAHCARFRDDANDSRELSRRRPVDL